MTLDLAGHSLVGPKGREVQLTRAEFALLAVLASRPGRVLSRDRLLDTVSGRRADAFDRSIDNLIARLRRKIENQGEEAAPHHYGARRRLQISAQTARRRRAVAVSFRRASALDSRASLRQSRRLLRPFSFRGVSLHDLGQRTKASRWRAGTASA